MEQIIKISEFVLKSFLHIWPYLLVTIPLAVMINLSGAAKYINKAFGKNPLISVLLATVVGAFSPFCSCGVIPVISSLLIGGVPLAPVMSFWIASPSMDPEIFFLSSAMIGWKLAIWRLASTFVISLAAGYITHFATIKGFISTDVLRTSDKARPWLNLKSLVLTLRASLFKNQARVELISAGRPVNVCCTANSEVLAVNSCCGASPAPDTCSCSGRTSTVTETRLMKISKEIIKATLLVTKFMGIAFLITALITFYVPADLIKGITSGNPSTQVVLATLIGIPMYTTNITALPLVGGLIDLGLNKGAALSFLIGGATTTLPAMIAVWGITKKRVFILYLSFALFGALLAGLCFNVFN